MRAFLPLTLVLIAGCAMQPPAPPTAAQIAEAAERERQAQLPLANASCQEVMRRANRPFRTALDGVVRNAAGIEFAERCLSWLAGESCDSLPEWVNLPFVTAVDGLVRDAAAVEYANRCLGGLATMSCDSLPEWVNLPFSTRWHGLVRDAAADEYANRCL